MPRYRTLDFQCPGCNFYEEHFHDLNEGELVLKCPNCEEHTMEEVWIRAPFGRVGGEGSPREIASYRQKCREHYVKKELDDVRHRHGATVDEARIAGAAKRLKSGQKPL